MIENTFMPDWVSPPGESIEDALDEADMMQGELARHLGWSVEKLHLLMIGELVLTADVADVLAKVLCGSSQFWLRREALYREALQRFENDTQPLRRAL